MLVVGIGVLFIVIGVLFMTGALSWFGRLPGDIRVERDNVRIYVPLVSMLIASIAVTIMLRIIRRFL